MFLKQQQINPFLLYMQDEAKSINQTNNQSTKAQLASKPEKFTLSITYITVIPSMLTMLSSLLNMIYSVAPSLMMLTLYFLFQLYRGRNDEPYDEDSGPLNVNSSREWVFLMEGSHHMFECIYASIILLPTNCSTIVIFYIYVSICQKRIW